VSVVREASGRYLARVSFTDRQSGERVYKKRRFDKKKDAEAWEAQQKADDSRGVRFEPSPEPFGAVLDRWLDDLTHTDRSTATIAQYRTAARLRFDAIRAVPVAELTKARLQRLINEWSGAGLSAGTVQNATIILRGVMQLAQDEGLIREDRNHAAVRLRVPTRDRRKKSIWSPDEVRAFLDSTRESPFHVTWVMLFATLARIGELAALRWDDIDFATGRVTIARTWTKDVTHHAVMGDTTKSDAGRRVIPVPADVLALLDVERRTRANDGGWFVPVGAAPMPPNTLRHLWTEAVVASGLPHLTPHGARRSGASVMVAAGIPVPVVQAILGHSSATVTLDAYVVPDAGDTRGAVEILSDLYTGRSTLERAQNAPKVVPFRQKSPEDAEKLSGG
jgi:integrase